MKRPWWTLPFRRVKRIWLRRNSQVRRTLRLARTQIGYKETPVNLTKYGEWYGWDGVPWCAIFVSWALSRTGRKFHESFVPTIVEKARHRQEGLAVIPFQDVPHWLKEGRPVLACYDWPHESPGTADHVEFVEKVLSGSTFRAIGGNTSAPGGNQSNGGEVCRNKRYTHDVLCFVKVGE